MPITLSFISANYVARANNYDGKEDWMYHDGATEAAMNPQRFEEIARDVSAAGFDYIDIWSAHCHWQRHDKEDYVEQVKGMLSNYDLGITSYAGGLVVENPQQIDQAFKFLKQLGCPIFGGGLWGMPHDKAMPVIDQTCAKYGLKYAFENHPEKTPREILNRIGNGQFKNIGVALDTGWCGTQGMDALEALKAIGDKLFLLHLKDVKAPGKHDTCALGEGIVPVEKVVRHLKDTGWQGNIAIEHEPYDRDPMPEVKRSAERVRQWLK